MSEPSRAEIDQSPGPLVLEFGASWCPHCQAIEPQVTTLRQQYRQVRYEKIEDGKGKPLGRSFAVKLWPTLVFLRDGVVQEQLVRPTPSAIASAFAKLAAVDDAPTTN